jgi:hypothetical protein
MAKKTEPEIVEIKTEYHVEFISVFHCPEFHYYTGDKVTLTPAQYELAKSYDAVKEI